MSAEEERSTLGDAVIEALMWLEGIREPPQAVIEAITVLNKALEDTIKCG